MRKQLLPIFTLLITLFILGGTIHDVQAGLNPPPKGVGEEEDTDEGGNNEDCLYAQIVQTLDHPSSAPIEVHVDIEYQHVVNNPGQTYSTSFHYNPFSYDEVENGVYIKNVMQITSCAADGGGGGGLSTGPIPPGELLYTYLKMTVRATYSDGTNTLTATIIIRDGEIVNIDDSPESFANELQGFPNPFSSSITARYELVGGVSEATIELINIQNPTRGTITISGPTSQGSHNIPFDASRLPSGDYILRVIIITAKNTTEYQSIRVVKTLSKSEGR